jgi:uncharacterized protein YbjT (DUF2867 family)
MTASPFVVTGATGQQGGAVARALLGRGHRVRALVRDATAPGARRLAEAGAELAVGDFHDAASLDRALAGAEAVFGVTLPFQGAATEARQGMALVDAARRAGVAHFVLTSAGSAGEPTGVPTFESKRRVEEHLRASGLPFTIVGPVYFMENLLTPFSLAGLRQGVHARWMPVDREVQLIAVEDIGRFCALVLERRAPFLGRRIDLAGDALDGRETAALLSSALGRDVRPVALDLQTFPTQDEAGRNVAAVLAWMARTGFHADIAALRREFPEVGWRTFAQWASTPDWGSLLGAPPA